MTSPPESPIEEVVFELEHTRVPKPINVTIEDLYRETKFSKQEIRIMYRGFKTECPEGVVHEECFKEIYAKFFPHGNSSLYAHHVFRTFDINSTGSVNFRDFLNILSTLLRGTVYDKVKWTFKLYDVNGDGRISRGEMSDLFHSIHELMGRRPHQPEEDRKAKEQLERTFRSFDPHNVGYINFEMWMKGLLTNRTIVNSFHVFHSDP